MPPLTPEQIRMALTEEAQIDPHGQRFATAAARIQCRLETLEYLGGTPSSDFYRDRWLKRRTAAHYFRSLAEVEEFAQSLLIDCRVAYRRRYETRETPV